MSLLPLDQLSGVFFIEARVLGSPSSIVSQVGLSLDTPNASLAVFSRTSGVLLVAGVGSYCAYRVCTNLLGNRFVWELLESRQFDGIPTADRRLLYSFNVDAEEEEENEEERKKRRRRELDEVMSVTSTSRSPSNMSLSRLSKVRKSSRGKGLYALVGGKPRAGVLSRQSSRHSSCSIPHSIVSSVKSASLRILWEGSQDAWDDEFAGTSHVQPSVICRNGAGIKAEDDLASLCSVFNDVLSVTSEVEEANGQSDEARSEMDESNSNDDSEWIRRLQDSKYMYQSMVAASEVGSVTSSRFIRKAKERPEESDLSPLSDLKDDLTKSSNSRRSNGRSMYDSAIGADLLSEDGSIPDQQKLDVLREDTISMAESYASLEWCDEGLRNREGTSSSNSSTEKPLTFGEDQEEWNCDVFRRIDVDSRYAPSDSRDLMVVACELFQPFSPPFKELQTIYHKRRYKRLAVLRDQKDFFEAFLRGLLYHNMPIVQERRWERLEQRLDRCQNEVGCSWTRARPDKIKASLQHFLAFANNPTPEALKTSSVELGEMLRVACVLEGVGLVDEAAAGLFNDSFPFHDLRQFAEAFRYDRLPPTEILLPLLSRVCGAVIELHHVHSLSQKPQVNIYTPSRHSNDTMVLLSYGVVPVPLYVVNDDE